MKNLLVANWSSQNRKYPKEKLETELYAQLENSLDVGWEPDDIVVATNFKFTYDIAVNIVELKMPKHCLTGSKMFAVRDLIRMGENDVIWAHDLDAWQTVPFDEPEFKDVGLTLYSRPKYNGGSVFWRPSALDIIEVITTVLEVAELSREEPTINKVLKSPPYQDRVTTVENGFNVGCSGFKERCDRSEKPIKVCHFHPHNRIAWDTHVRDRNRLGFSTVPDRLMTIMLEFFGEKIKTYTYPEGERGYDGDWQRPVELQQRDTPVPG